MRVTLLTQNARAGDAIGRQVAEKAAYFLDRGAEVAVVLADANHLHPQLRSISIRQRAETVGAGWYALERADLVSVEYPHYYPLLDLLPLLADGRRKILFDYHGVTPPEFATGGLRDELLRGQESRGIAAFADAVIVHSDFTRTELRDSVSNLSAQVHSLGCVVDERFTPGRPRKSLQARLGLGDARILLYVGRLAANKRVPTLIAALQKLTSESPAVHGVVIGPSGDAYEAERLRCRELAADLGVDDRLHFLGVVDEASLLDAYRSADALVMPSVHEGFCLPVAEAMACGVPVIAARAAALPDTLGHAGLTFAPEDSADLAQQARRLFAAPRAEPGGRIAVVIGPEQGGAERSLATLADCLKEAGHAVEFVAATDRRLEHLRAEFSAIIVGPVGAAHCRDTVRRFGARTILAPCLHDEPISRATTTRALFEQVGGVLFHSEAERDLAAKLGLNHPNQQVIGAWIDTSMIGNGDSGRRTAGYDRYFVYCGRRVAEKGLERLFGYARQLEQIEPGLLRIAFLGEGPLTIPDEPWAIDLGRVSESDKRDVIAGARGLINLSCNESLSLVVLESLALGTPVVVAAENPVTLAHIAGGGGRSVANFAEFVDAVTHYGTTRPTNIADYVRREYGSRADLNRAVLTVVRGLDVPLAKAAAGFGAARAQRWTRRQWRAQFERVIEQTLHAPSIRSESDIVISTSEPVVNGPSWSVDLHLRSGRPLAATGPGRSELLVRWRDDDGEVVGSPWTVALSELVLPGETARVNVPLRSRPSARSSLEAGLRVYRLGSGTETWFGPLAVLASQCETTTPATPRRRTVAAAIARAGALYALPDSYVDPPYGRLGRLKQWLKAKLLHNFRVGYVDVLSRQQSRFNRRLLEAVQELAATMPADEGILRSELADLRRQNEILAHRVAQLESVHTPRVRQEAA